MAKGFVAVTVERCKGCGFCVEFCPTDCIELSSQYNIKGYHTPVLAHKDDCTGCDICGMVCPDYPIYGFIRKKEN